MRTESSTESAAENYPESMVRIGMSVRHRLFGLLKPLPRRSVLLPDPRVVEWIERDDWIAICVKMGLNAREIVELSYSWPRPVTTQQQVYEMIERLRLTRAYKRKDKIRAGHHNRNIMYAFSKLTGQAMEHGYVVRDIFRDAAPQTAQHSVLFRFRPDLALRIGSYQFYVEVQLSKIEGTRWGQKFSNYLKLYRTIKSPFRVLFLVDKNTDISKLRQRARNVLEKNPNLNMFLFITLDQFENERDILKGRVWFTAWHPKNKIGLL